jgi:type I restriction enzyme, S subunit
MVRALLLRRVVQASSAPRAALDDVAVFLDSQREPITEAERQRRCADPTRPRYPYYGANGRAGWIDDFRFDEPLVLLAEDGGNFGSETRPIAYRVSGRCWVNNHAHVLRPLEQMDVDYLCYALQVRPDVGGLISGSTRGKLPRSVAGRITVPVPALEEQRRIAADLRDRLALIDAIAGAASAQRDAADALSTALLRQAFEGTEAP